jgi:hypothetical protein
MSSIPTARSPACLCRFRARCSRLTARAWHDALKVNAGSRFALTKYASLFASFDGEFANSEHSYAGLRGQIQLVRHRHLPHHASSLPLWARR